MPVSIHMHGGVLQMTRIDDGVPFKFQIERSRGAGWLSEVLRRLGRREESAPLRRKLFERTLAVSDLHAWLDDLPLASHSAAVAKARELALDHDVPVTAARLLLDVGDDDATKSMLLREPERISGVDYGALVPLAEAFESRRRWRGATAEYRALLWAILAGAYVRAYGRAARCWHGLHAIADQGVDLAPLEWHDLFRAATLKQHARNVSFWQDVKDSAQEGRRGGDEEAHLGVD